MSFAGYRVGKSLYVGQSTIVCSAEREADGAGVVLKYQRAEYPSLAEILRYRHEFDVLRRLESPHVVRALSLERAGNRVVLVTEDFGGVTLRDYFRAAPPTLERLLDVAIAVLRALTFVHERGVVHRDINPTNVLVEPRSGAVKLADFGIATLLSREAQDLRHPEHIEGTFEYMSPEQTGRMNRTQDYRSDFYSLGATLYALARGEPPFKSQDHMELIHHHIAKEPSPLHTEAPWVPEAVSRIIAKLLAKSAEDRYQSPRGLLHDLAECRAQLHRGGAVTPFPLGTNDTSPRLEVPQGLYGRAAELSILLHAFERVARGRSELLLVGGHSGIGKSALVNEVHKPIVALRGSFIRGKYDQYGRDVPYSALTRAFDEVVQHLLMEPPESIERWRGQILEALGSGARVVLDVVPSLELLVGAQPPVAPLGPTDARNRFDAAFRAFVHVVATPEHPLVLFLDDLQWADVPSLNLLEALLTSAETRSLFVIAAYRDNEVDAAHPFLLAVQEVRKSEAMVHEIKLEPLTLPDSVALVADTVRRGHDEVLPLATLLHQRTAGNPFFLIQLLRTLCEDGLFTLSPDGRWTWDMRRIVTLGLTDNVVDLMTSRLTRLPTATQRLLGLATCIGNQFDLGLLSRAAGAPLQRTAESLWPALSEGLILPITDDHAALHGAGPAGELDAEAEATQRALDARVERAVTSGELRVAYRFLHDRVQQAAYSLISADERKVEHLKLGRMLLGDSDAEPPADQIFDIVQHLEQGIDLVTDPAERLRIARLTFRAGQRAKSAAAYQAGASYHAAAMALLGPDIWSTDHQLALDLHRERAECEYITGNFAVSEELAAAAIARSRTTLDKAALYATRIQLYIAEGSSAPKAVALGLEALAQLGYVVPETAAEQQAAVGTERSKIERLLADREIADLHEHVEMTDPDRQAAMGILMLTWGATYLTKDQMLGVLLASFLVSTSLEHGHTAVSAFAYALHGMMTALGGDYPRGHAFAQLAQRVNERFPDPALTVRTGSMVAVLMPYFNPLEAVLPIFRRGYQIAPQAGEVLYVTWGLLQTMIFRTMKGDPLSEVFDDSTKYLGFVQHSHYRDVIVAYHVHRQMVRALQGLTRERNSLDEDGKPTEAECLAEYRKNEYHGGLLMHSVFRTVLHVIFGDPRAALETAAVTEGLIPFDLGAVSTTNHYYYQSLALSALYTDADEAERAGSMELLSRNLARLSGWAETAPWTFAHRRDLVAAEIARCRGDGHSAARLYDRSMDGAQASGFLHDEALAAETAAHFYLARGSQRIARLYMTEAYYGYMRWGAAAKVADLKQHHAHLLLTDHFAGPVTSKEHSSTGRNPGALAATLDFSSMMKAAQAISGELGKSALVDRLMRIAIENAGARRGWLIVDGPGGSTVIASALIDSQAPIRLEPTPLDAAPELSQAIVRYVIRTREPMVLHDASREGPFCSDPRVSERRCKSVVAVPLLRQGRLTGVLYLENDLVEGAFSGERVEVLYLLAAQAAISLEISNLYEELESRVAERTKALAEANRSLREGLNQLNSAQRQLGEASRRAGMAEIATSVLHNIGNLLNSVNVSSGIVIDSLQQSRSSGITRVAQLLAEQKDIGAFFSGDVRGKRMPEYLGTLAQALEAEQAATLAEMESLQKNIDHIKVIVSMQQTHAKFGGVVESLSLADLLDDAIRLNTAANDRRAVDVAREYDDLPLVDTDRHKLFQIIMNLLSNARHALQSHETERGRVTVRLRREDSIWVAVEVEDCGTGITQENLTKVFNLGFTTKKDGHGFGLHSSSCSAIEMGGTLTAHSEGPGRGALFRLRLPLRDGGAGAG